MFDDVKYADDDLRKLLAAPLAIALAVGTSVIITKSQVHATVVHLDAYRNRYIVAVEGEIGNRYHNISEFKLAGERKRHYPMVMMVAPPVVAPPVVAPPVVAPPVVAPPAVAPTVVAPTVVAPPLAPEGPFSASLGT